VSVKTHLLAVVLSNVRVVPVHPRVGALDGVGELLADRHRLLRLVRPIEAVVEAQAVPVDRRLEIATVLDPHADLAAFGRAKRRPGHRSAVAEHSYRVVADSL